MSVGAGKAFPPSVGGSQVVYAMFFVRAVTGSSAESTGISYSAGV